MANPQVEQGYIRISNELWDEILRRDFSKRQQKIILFIWRLSYGTGQKDCKIDKFNMLELAGMYKTDVKKELKYLRDCAVLDWDEKTMVFSINKNYKLWQISPNKNWDGDKFKSLIHQNLSRKKVGKTLTDKKIKVSKTLTFKGEKVSKLLTLKLVKHLPPHPLILTGARYSAPLKTVLNTSFKDIKRKEEEKGETIIDFLIENKIVHPGGLTRTLLDDLNDVNDNFGFENPEEMIKEAVKDAVRGNGRTWKFVYNKLNMWRKQGIKNVYEAQFKSQKQQTKKPFYPKQQQVRQVPSWIENEQQQPDAPQQQSGIDVGKEKAELLEFIQQNAKRRHS